MVRGEEFHSIIQNIFEDVKGLNVSEQVQVNCPRCADRDGLGHSDGKYNLEINTAKRVFRCWRCDEPKFSGSLRRLVRAYGSNIDNEMYKAFAGTSFDYEWNEDDDDYIQVSLPDEMIYFSEMDASNPEHFEAYNYLVTERKISREIILKYKLGFCITGKYAKRIIVPSYDSNGVVNYFVGRTYDPTEKKKYDNPKSDKDKIIFNEGFVNWDVTVYLVEGAFEMFTFPVNIVPMLGKTISNTLYFKLKELKPNVVILLDPDAYKNSIELFYMLHTIYIDCEERVKLVKLPAKDDLDELRKNHGIDEVIKILYTARGLTIDDYFYSNLKKPYEYKGKYRNNSYSGSTEWKSGVTKNFIR